MAKKILIWTQFSGWAQINMLPLKPLPNQNWGLLELELSLLNFQVKLKPIHKGAQGTVIIFVVICHTYNIWKLSLKIRKCKGQTPAKRRTPQPNKPKMLQKIGNYHQIGHIGQQNISSFLLILNGTWWV